MCAMNTFTGRDLKIGAAVLLTGLQAGAQVFVSGVSCGTMDTAKKRSDEAAVYRTFPLWWSSGRNVMKPLTIGSTIANLVAFEETKEPYWVVAACLSGLPLVIVLFLMGEDTSILVDVGPVAGSKKTLLKRVQAICAKTHLSAISATAALAVSLGLALRRVPVLKI